MARSPNTTWYAQPTQLTRKFICQALRFFGMLVKRPGSDKYFERPEALSALCEKVIIPNGALRGKSVPFQSDLCRDGHGVV